MRFSLCIVATGLLLACSASPSRAEDRVSDLLGWVPGQTNLVLFVDVDAIYNSPIAKKEKWGSGNHAVSGLDSLPLGISRFVVASQFDPATGASWEVIIAGLRRPVTDADLVKRTGGTLDTIGGKSVVLTPKQKLAVNLGKGVAGTHQPANRQDAGRWLREVDGKLSPRFSAYLKQAGAEAAGQTPVVMALDTTDMFAPALVKTALSKTAALKGKTETIAPLADLFGKMQGITLLIHTTDRMTGEIRLSFGAATDPLKDVAKPLVLEVLERMGMHSKEMDDWTMHTGGTTVTFSGPLSLEGAHDLLSPMLRPSLGTLDQSEPAPAAALSKAQVSLKYYQAVQKKMGEVRKSNNSSFAKLATTFNSAARHIDELPILNVDDELLDWGNSVAATFRSMAIVAQYTGGMMSLAEANKATVSVTSPNYYYGVAGGGGGGYYGGYGWGAAVAVPSGTTSTTTVSNYGQVSNMQAMTKESEAQYRRNTWKAIDSETAIHRRSMVKKYNIEF